MRRLLLLPVLALSVTAAPTTDPAGRPAGDQGHRQALSRRQPVGGGISVVLPAGWHLTHGMGTPLRDPLPRLSAATFPVHFSSQ
ncbi:MAG: hypothetical protein ACXVY5_06480, partial [Gaiellales bacterium]